MIRPYQLTDKEILIEIFKLNTPQYFDSKEIQDFEIYLETHAETYLTVEYEGKIVGGTGFYVNKAAKSGHITWIFFNPNYAGHGLGRQAVEHCLSILKQEGDVEKLVVTTSQLAYKFFEKFGYSLIRTEKDYWGEGFDLYEMEMPNNSQMLEAHIEINVNLKEVWDVLTNPVYAKILGNELDKNAFLQSDWQLNSKVYFMYEPDKIVATGIITDFKLHAHIFTDYKEINYTDSFSLTTKNNKTVLTIKSGPYPDDYKEQIVVWKNWLLKVKELSETLK